DKSRAAAVRRTLIVVGVFGAALLYGDGMITPAISVLCAVERLQIDTPCFTPCVLPLRIIILGVLFVFQQSGTAGIGKVFGSVRGHCCCATPPRRTIRTTCSRRAGRSIRWWCWRRWRRSSPRRPSSPASSR